MLVGLAMMLGNIVNMVVAKRHGRRELILKCSIPMGISIMGVCFAVSYHSFTTEEESDGSGGDGIIGKKADFIGKTCLI